MSKLDDNLTKLVDLVAREACDPDTPLVERLDALKQLMAYQNMLNKLRPQQETANGRTFMDFSRAVHGDGDGAEKVSGGSRVF